MSDCMLFFNGKICAMDACNTMASSLLVQDGTVAALDPPSADTAALRSGLRCVDLKGAVVLPGLIDTHLHLGTLGDVARAAFLFDTRSIAEIVERLRAHAARQPDGAVLGYGFNFRADLLAERRWPTATDLDRVAPGRPVLVFDVNKVFVNSSVLKQIPIPTPVPTGAARGDTGMFFGPARAMVPCQCWNFLKDETRLEEDIVRAMEICAAHGITRAVNANVSLEQLNVLRRLDRQGRLPIKLMVLMIGVAPDELARHDVHPGHREGRLTFGPLKFFWDNFVMHKTAWMHQPYIGEPDNHGGARMTTPEFRRVLTDCFDAGWPVGVHCTGDRALDELAGIFDAERARMAGLPRCHVIHGYFPSPHAMQICRDLDVPFAVQPGFIRCWGDSLLEFLGAPRANQFLPLHDMLENGLTVAGGSDAPITWPVAGPDMATAMTRRTAGGQLLAQPGTTPQNLTPMQALGIYTIGGARLAGWEHEAGTLEIGKSADMTVWDRDLRALDADAIANAKVLMTVVDGQPVFQAPGF